MEGREPWRIAAEAAGQRQILLWALVLSAADIPHRVIFTRPCWQLLVSPDDEAAAQEELAAFEAENHDWPPAPAAGDDSLFLVDRPVVIPVIGCLLAVYAMSGSWQEEGLWFAKGAAITATILEGREWWRVVTALTLHADVLHLVGNTVIGGVLAYFLCRLAGSGFGWLLILLAGTLGNALNVVLRGSGSEFVGFSTAIFGTVGILGGLRVARLTSAQDVMIGAGGALSLLALLGSEGERTDLGAHLWGLVAGLLLGLIVARSGMLRWAVLPRWQLVAAVAGLGIVAGAWWLALLPG
ncbi:MAG TPA: rhomboid family intramembrane serine protease [Desulfurivibrionaceae bacterium]|nr:rhomboid family intramembrane serine protease [Desulfurivibrionaceae bacterium]